jgi:hypothetical protein
VRLQSDAFHIEVHQLCNRAFYLASLGRSAPYELLKNFRRCMESLYQSRELEPGANTQASLAPPE